MREGILSPVDPSVFLGMYCFVMEHVKPRSHRGFSVRRAPVSCKFPRALESKSAFFWGALPAFYKALPCVCGKRLDDAKWKR